MGEGREGGLPPAKALYAARHAKHTGRPGCNHGRWRQQLCTNFKHPGFVFEIKTDGAQAAPSIFYLSLFKEAKDERRGGRIVSAIERARDQGR